jgi:predicted ArsR family transcriptional regulator
METTMTKNTRRSPKPVTTAATNAKPSAPRGRQRHRTKKQIALTLLERSKGASIAEMQKSMGWQAHSVRGFLAATVKKMPGVILTSEKAVGRPRRYHIEAAGE